MHPPLYILCIQGGGTAQLGMGGASTWEFQEHQWSESEEEKFQPQPEKVVTPPTHQAGVSGQKEASVKSKKLVPVEMKEDKVESDSEEEDTVVLTTEELSGGTVRGGTTNLSELIALESRKGSIELDESKESPSATQQPATASSSRTTRQSKGKGKRGEMKQNSDSPVDVEVKTTAASADPNGESARTSGRRGKGKKRKASKT